MRRYYIGKFAIDSPLRIVMDLLLYSYSHTKHDANLRHDGHRNDLEMQNLVFNGKTSRIIMWKR